jgi:hypothetical protein
MAIDLVFVALLASMMFGPAVASVIIANWYDNMNDELKKKRLPCLSTAPKPDTRTECPKCRLREHRRIVRTYTQPGVAVWRYYKCKCGQPFRQGDKFSDKI